MNNVACYKDSTALITNKKVNLIYGLNGTGKSTLSNYLYDRNDPNYEYCAIEGLANEDILVYNQRFISEYFYESDTLKGIFTLSKENKVAEETILKTEKEIHNLDDEQKNQNNILEETNLEISRKKQEAENTVWNIKQKYTGGDRVLEYCLTGLQGKKESLFTHILQVSKPVSQPIMTIAKLKEDVESLKGNAAQKYNELPLINFDGTEIETNSIFQKSIVGNENSTISELITKLGNSDWVKAGLDYLPSEIGDKTIPCPFCQETTVNSILANKIKNYFDGTYTLDIEEIKRLSSIYTNSMNAIPSEEIFISNPFIIGKKDDFENRYKSVLQCVSQNKRAIEDKIKSPSQKIFFIDSTTVVNDFNDLIKNVNKEITEHNARLDNKESSLNKIKIIFWEIMRWEYDQTISNFLNEKSQSEIKVGKIKEKLSTISTELSKKKQYITEQQKKTVNIDEAVRVISDELIDLGIDSFKIEKHTDVLYKITRINEKGDTFKTLSEGEKMIISFLYFIELCKGKKSASDTNTGKIIVIDDPISSLSHIYVFNIGLLIKNNFTNPKSQYDQVIILTHSLYFFYELTFTKQEDRKQYMALYRLIKTSNGAEIKSMHYHEIQNDYHSYWDVIKDINYSPALIANCMRNIIEYFFNFIEKMELANVFQKQSLQDVKYQAFYRYINKESHSLGENIFDIKEFDYNTFKDAFRLVFVESGYEGHYNKMMQ
ncbi:AAA family ATPase [Leadbettera azotonutricia]|nr:AAA family ATPase [Leadbettera azotonutricia]